MAKLKRNMIELLVNPEEVAQGGEPAFKKYWTPVFIPLSVVYEAIDLTAEAEKKNAGEKEMIDKLLDFVAEKVYGGQFTRDDLKNGLHAPDAVRVLQEQVLFIAQGQQSEETKKFLKEKSR